ncbi:emp24/gp25L/p24 family/GOLD [Cladochytrium replicatum]|nr:emp24/gp25L/p24 family/GOLD [Cladochytrium replicatum]
MRRSMAMGALAVLATMLALAPSLVYSTTVTYRMAAHERPCFYTTADKVNEKMAFYFAVQTGGDFDIDYEITGPDGTLYTSGMKERQIDIVLAARAVGEHGLCFFNSGASFAEKVIDLEVTAEHEITDRSGGIRDRDAATGKAKSQAEDQYKQIVNAAEVHMGTVGGMVNQISRLQRYFRTRENRNFATVASTESRIFWFALGESGLIVGMGVLQVFVIQRFFSPSNRRRGGI